MTLLHGPWPWAVLSVGLVVMGVVEGRRAAPLSLARGRAVVCIGVFGLVLIGCLAAQDARPQLLGLPVVLAPGLAATAALLAFAVVPWRRGGTSGVRSAALEPRPVLMAVRPRDLVLPVLPGGVLVALLLVTGLTAAPDEAGRSRAFTLAHGSASTTSSPYPGWFSALPLLLLTALLVAAAVLAMRRTMVLPAIALDRAVDLGWRRAVQRALAALAAAALLLDRAGITWSIGAALRSSTDVLPPGVERGVLDAVAIASTGATPVLLAVAVGVLVMALARSRTIGRTAVAA